MQIPAERHARILHTLKEQGFVTVSGLSDILDAASPYHKASYAGLPGLVGRLAASTMGVRR